MEILYKDKNIVAISKPVGLSSGGDLSGADDAMTRTSDMLRQMNEDKRLWLVHRLDNVTSGVLIFARNKKAAVSLSDMFSSSSVRKEYLAIVEGAPKSNTLVGYLVRDNTSAKAKITDKSEKGAKLAKLEYSSLETKEYMGKLITLVSVLPITGRFHQIRAQFSAEGHPLVGDGKYGSTVKSVRSPSLFCCRLSFSLDDVNYDITASPDISKHPWNLFDKKHFGVK